MRSKRAIKNIGFNYLNKLTSLFLMFFITSVIYKTLDKSLYGINALLFQTLSYLSLAELGIGTAAIVALYKTVALDNKEETNKILSATHYVYKKIGLIILAIGIVLSFFIGSFFSIPPEHQLI